MQDQKTVRLNDSEAILAKKNLIELLQAEGMLKLEKISHEDSYTRYHFSAKSDECDNICVDIPKDEEKEYGMLETYAV